MDHHISLESLVIQIGLLIDQLKLNITEKSHNVSTRVEFFRPK